ncbi:hypothetical protein JOB18_019889 [Solea senegalensis]|uniref:Secreted protein n=1 Tax=Solea senegalensis TaxID=28829 RepID=A0AAV6RNH6_SOLSE|nr:hypothetical protein JOB18_019889 [Solea senegalensis]
MPTSQYGVFSTLTAPSSILFVVVPCCSVCSLSLQEAWLTYLPEHAGERFHLRSSTPPAPDHQSGVLFSRSRPLTSICIPRCQRSNATLYSMLLPMGQCSLG